VVSLGGVHSSSVDSCVVLVVTGGFIYRCVHFSVFQAFVPGLGWLLGPLLSSGEAVAYMLGGGGKQPEGTCAFGRALWVAAVLYRDCMAHVALHPQQRTVQSTGP